MEDGRCIDEPWPFRVLSIALLAAAYVFIYRPTELRREALLQAAYIDTQKASFAQDTLRRTPVYEHAAERIRRALQGLDLQATGNLLVAHALMDLDEDAVRNQVLLTSIEPGSPVAESVPIVVHVHGPYLALMHFLQMISSGRTIIRIDGLDFLRDDGPSIAVNIHMIDVTIHASLLALPSQIQLRQQSPSAVNSAAATSISGVFP